MENSKLMKSAGNLDTLVRVAGEIFKAFGIVCIVFTVLVAIFGEWMYVPGTVSLDLEFVKIHLAEQYQVITGLMKIYTIAALLAGCGICFMLHYAAGLVRRILLPMKEGRPFEENTPGDLKKIALCVMIGGAVIQIVGIVERVILTKAFPMEEIFASQAIAKTEFVYNMDFGFLLAGSALLLLSYVFAHGRKLQQESDETL